MHIDTTDILWYNLFIKDSMCGSSCTRGQAGIASLYAKGFALHTLRELPAPSQKAAGELYGIPGFVRKCQWNGWPLSNQGISLPTGAFYL